MTGTLTYVGQAFGDSWRTRLAPLVVCPAALFFLVGGLAVLALALSGLTARSRTGYQRGGWFLNGNEKSSLRGLGRNYYAVAQVRLAELANPAESVSVHLRRRCKASSRRA